MKYLKKILLMMLGILLVACSSNEIKKEVTTDKKVKVSKFVTSQNGKFWLNGEEFRFVGTNNYYMHYADNQMIDDVINNASDMGIKVLRMWGFMDGKEGPAKAHNAYMQYELGKYGVPEDRKGGINGFERIDYAVAKAKEKGIKLVIAFTNNWNDFGGMMQYVNWIDEISTHDEFYYDDTAKEAYKKYVNYFINRTNQYTGVKYSDEESIFAWELANEPRAEADKTGDMLLEWVDEMSSYIKSIDNNHMVAVGDEGFFNRKTNEGYANEGEWAYTGYSGVDWDRLVALPNIDYGTLHLYPEHWGVSEENREGWGTKYIIDHIKAGKKIGKPVVLEEYGVTKGASENRLMTYDIWNNAVYENDGAGAMFWILTGIDTGDGADKDGLYPDYDGFRIVNDESDISNLIKGYARLFNGENLERTSDIYIASPYNKKRVKGIVNIRAKVVEYSSKVKDVILTIGNNVIGKMEYNKETGYFEYKWDTTKEKDGDKIWIKVEANFDDGSKDVERTSTVVKNKIEYKLSKKVTFDNSVEGFVKEGSWQASFKKPAIEYTKEGSLSSGVGEFDK